MFLVPFSLSQSILDGEIQTIPLDVCLRWVKILQERGIFLHSNSSFINSPEFKSIKRNKVLFKLLGEAVKRNGIRLKPLENCPVDLNMYDDLESLNRDQNDVSCFIVENTFTHKKIPFKEDSLNIHDDNIEIAKINGLDSSHFIEKSLGIQSQNVLAGEDLESVWQTRFHHLANLSDEVVIVDRFCMADDRNCSGLKFILNKLYESEKQIRRVVIMTAYKDDHSLLNENEENRSQYTLDGVVENTKRLLEKLKKKDGGFGSIMEIHLVLTHNKLFGDESHFRFIRFNNIAAEIDAGCALFRNRERELAAGNAKIHRNATCAIKQVQKCTKVINGETKESDFHRDVENKLLQGAKYEGKQIRLYSAHPE